MKGSSVGQSLAVRQNVANHVCLEVVQRTRYFEGDLHVVVALRLARVVAGLG